MNLKDVPSQGRATQGVYVMRMDSGDKVASVSLMKNIEEEAQPGETREKRPLKETSKGGKKQEALL